MMSKLAIVLAIVCATAILYGSTIGIRYGGPESISNRSQKSLSTENIEQQLETKTSQQKKQFSSATTLLNDVAAHCLSKLDLNEFKNLYNQIQFWQTWSHLQFVTLLNVSKVTHLFTDEVKKEATRRAIEQWTKFDPNTTLNVPAYFKDFIYFQDTDFWDPKNKAIIWDDRQWLGLSYLQLYRHYHTSHPNASKFLQVAQHLYTLIITKNADPRSPGYIGLEWKPGTNYRNSVTNEQFLVLTGRLYSITNKQEYLDVMRMQYKHLFLQPGKYINNNTFDVFPDGEYERDGFYTYNQGLALEGLAYLAVFDQAKSTEYVSQFARMVNGFTNFFTTNKHICRELNGGTRDQLRCGSIFRAILFRHIVRGKIIFDTYEPVFWNQLLALAPVLKIFIIDNFQAMCKFSDTLVPYWWQQNAGMVHYYNQFNQFYVLYSGAYLFNLEQLQTTGISMSCQGTLSVNYNSSRVKQVKLTTLQVDTYKASYKNNRTFNIPSGLTVLNNLLLEDFCAMDNNRNLLTLSITYTDNTSAVYTLAHLQHTDAQFSLIPDRTGEQIGNNYGVRINSDCKNNRMTYESKKVESRVTLSSQEPGCTKKSYIQLDIQ